MTRGPRVLALLGGAPAFDRYLHVGAPNTGDMTAFSARLEGLLARNWLTNDGPLVQEFEATLRGFLGVKHCLATCNATVALEILIRALDLTGEIILPSFTFVATAHAPMWLGLKPVFCDIDAITHNLNPARVEELITSSTTAILGVHLWGRPCDIAGLDALAQRHGLHLLFDAAHAFSAAAGARMIGGLGEAEVFSFHATKFFNTFEGGAIATNDDGLAERVRLMRNFGFAGYDNVLSLGVNGKMSEVSAAMGLTSFESLNAFIERNRQNHLTYQRELAVVPEVRLLAYSDLERSNYQYVVLELEPRFDVADRDGIVAALHAENVMARRYFYPGCHRMEPYRTLFPDAGVRLPITEAVADRVIVLPTGCAVGGPEIRTICSLLRRSFDGLPRIRALLAGERC